MTYTILLSEQAKKEIAAIKKSGDKPTIKKITNMLLELQEHPRTGTGQVEHLKHYVFEETWSRRINKQYRMIYEIHDAEVYVARLPREGIYFSPLVTNDMSVINKNTSVLMNNMPLLMNKVPLLMNKVPLLHHLQFVFRTFSCIES